MLVIGRCPLTKVSLLLVEGGNVSLAKPSKCFTRKELIFQAFLLAIIIIIFCHEGGWGILRFITEINDAEFHCLQHGRRSYHEIDRCVNRCCQTNPCLQGGTCQEICELTIVRFNCSCPPAYTGQRCETLKHPRNCKDVARNGAKISGMFRVYDSQDKPFQVYCDLTHEPCYVWALIQSFSYGNNDQFKMNRFDHDFPVNEEENTINWSAYRLSLSRMLSLAATSTHLRATCNFPDEGLVYIDYARAKLEGHDLFGQWHTQCRTYEYLNIRDIECNDCTAGTWQNYEMWHINSEGSFNTAGCEFNGEAGAVFQEQNFGFYGNVNVNFRCTSGQNSTTQHWIGSRK